MIPRPRAPQIRRRLGSRSGFRAGRGARSRGYGRLPRIGTSEPAVNGRGARSFARAVEMVAPAQGESERRADDMAPPSEPYRGSRSDRFAVDHRGPALDGVRTGNNDGDGCARGRRLDALAGEP